MGRAGSVRDPGYPAIVGEDCVVSHNAIVHGCVIERGCLIGMRATVLNGARIGEGSIVAAGALVPEGKEYPPGSLIVGIPARAAKDVNEEQTSDIARGVREYVERAASTQRVAGAQPISLYPVRLVASTDVLDVPPDQTSREHDRKGPGISSIKVDKLRNVNYD